MPFKRFESTEARPETFTDLYTKALTIAQVMSSKWKEIPEDEVWQAADPDLARVYQMTSKEKGGKTGIQEWFEGQMKFIEGQAKHDDSIKVRYMYRMLNDLERYEKSLDRVLAGK